MDTIRFVGVTIAVVPLLSTLIMFNKKELLAPTNLFSMMYLIKILIPTLIYYWHDNIQSIGNAFLFDAVSDSHTYFKYCILQTLSYYLVIIGIGIRVNNRKVLFVSSQSYASSPKPSNDISINFNIRRWGIFFTIVGGIDFLLIMSKVGGIQYFFTHLQYRTFLTRDLDLLSWILPCLQYGPLLIVYSLKGENKPISCKLLVLIVLAGFFSGLGGRKAVVLLLFEAITIYHYTVRPISINKILAPKYIILFLFIALFFVTFVQFRTEGALEKFIEDPIAFFKSNNQGVIRVFTSESYVPFYMFIIKHFDNASFWHGSSYLGLLTAIIPSSLFAAKPPVDDGMYLYSICQGRTDIHPVMRTSELNGSSYPLETFGAAYANFGIVGLMIGMLLLGIVISFFYRKLNKTQYSFFSIIIYSQVIFGFEFSTLRIFQLFQAIVIAMIIIKCTDMLYLDFNNRKGRNNRCRY